MILLNSIADLASLPGPVFLAIGVFDGVHLGHKAVIERAAADAKAAGGTAVVVTFNPHPMRVLRTGGAPRLITSTKHKTRLIKELGVTFLLVIPFNTEFAATPPEQFIQSLHAACPSLREICVGHQWSFGKGRAGNLEMLEIWGAKLGFDEVGIPAVEIDGQVVSSTLIRSAVENGDLATAAKLLGREYTVLGTVIEGDHLGRKLGFPTANLSAHNEQFPPDGVYAVEAIHREKKYRGVVNIGIRPTIYEKEGQRLLEIHLFDFHENIYGEDIEVFFRRFIRREQKFSDLDELKAQIARDCADAATT
jgi:riboflavin kinase/FMN adenylyltransferase